VTSPMLTNLWRKLTAFARRDDLRVVRVGGRVWRLSPAGRALFGDSGPDLDAWLAGRAAVVKSNPARTVYRVELPGATVFVKHCKISGPRAWGREVIRPPKAQLEFENTRTLRERGVAAIEPLAWGAPDSSWPGESFLVTRELTHAIPFVHYLESVLPALPRHDHPQARRRIAVALGEFVARLHDSGVAHPDPHPGNLLLEFREGVTPHFALIDLHAVSVGNRLTSRAGAENLVLFNRWFQLRATRTDRARFWHAYCLARATLPPAEAGELRAGAAELELRTVASNLRFWAGRRSRCLGSNRYFRRVGGGNYRGFAVRELPEDFLRGLLADPDSALARPDARILKDSRTSTVAVLAMPTADGPVPVVLKRVNLRSRAEPLKNLFRASHVLRSWVNGHTLRDRCLPTPRPLAVFHRYRATLPCEGYLLTELVPDAKPLDPGDGPAMVRLARLLRAMHDRGVSHRDLKAANVLLARGAEPVLVDLVGVRALTPPCDRQRAKELARLNASFLGTAASRTARLRFLLAYLAAGVVRRGGWKSWWGAVARATAAKVAKNRRNGRTLG
jgi:tRNA A-37 threonylcarbamoyl transferase component Bud32